MSDYGRHSDVDFSGRRFAEEPTAHGSLVEGPPIEGPFVEGSHPEETYAEDDPFEDDLTEQLAARAPRRLANRATIVLVGLVLVVGGFVAGAQVEKNFGHLGTAASATPTAFPTGGRGGGFFGGGGATPSTAASGPTTGTVKFVDGTTVYITTANGDVVTIHTDGSTAVQTTQPGSLKDLPVGAQVTVTGQAGTDGSVTATKITKDH